MGTRRRLVRTDLAGAKTLYVSSNMTCGPCVVRAAISFDAQCAEKLPSSRVTFDPAVHLPKADAAAERNC